MTKEDMQIHFIKCELIIEGKHIDLDEVYPLLKKRMDGFDGASLKVSFNTQCTEQLSFLFDILLSVLEENKTIQKLSLHFPYPNKAILSLDERMSRTSIKSLSFHSYHDYPRIRLNKESIQKLTSIQLNPYANEDLKILIESEVLLDLNVLLMFLPNIYHTHSTLRNLSIQTHQETEDLKFLIDQLPKLESLWIRKGTKWNY